MSVVQCPVCLGHSAAPGRARDYGELQPYDCSRCGSFSITASALTMFGHADAVARAILSHQLRRAADSGQPITVKTDNLTELLAAPRPDHAEQMRLLLTVIRDGLQGDNFGEAQFSDADLEMTVAKVGVTGIGSVKRLIEDGERRGLLTQRIDYANNGCLLLAMTSDGLEALRGAAQSPTPPDSKSSGQLHREPPWLDRLPDEALRELLGETYHAINAGLLALPLMGARAAFDRAMDLKLGEDCGNFREKFKAMKVAGHVSDREIRILEPMIDAGHAASHRAWLPTLDLLLNVVDELEHKIRDWFIRETAAEAVRRATPPRRPVSR